MSIRFTLTDHATGQTKTIDAPRRGEFVKDGVVKTLPPAREQANNLMATIKAVTKLGQTGGCLSGS